MREREEKRERQRERIRWVKMESGEAGEGKEIRGKIYMRRGGVFCLSRMSVNLGRWSLDVYSSSHSPAQWCLGSVSGS
jgi:uncharacterized Zn finger protein